MSPVSVLLALLLCAAPAFDTFDGPLDPARWYIGVPKAPKRGVLRIPKQGWIVSRNLPDKGVTRIEVFFRSRGGALELAFFSEKEPLSSPAGDPIVIKKGGGARAPPGQECSISHGPSWLVVSDVMSLSAI